MSKENENAPNRTTLLRDCKMCGREISPYSLFCRNCGHPQGRPLAIALLIVFLIVLLALYVGFMLFCACNHERFEVSSGKLHLPARSTSRMEHSLAVC